MLLQVATDDEDARARVRHIAAQYGFSRYGREQPDEKDPNNYWLLYDVPSDESRVNEFADEVYKAVPVGKVVSG